MSDRKHLPPVDMALDMLALLQGRELTRDELAQHYGVSTSTVWMHLKRLVDRGFVRERESSSGRSDHRWRHVYTTKAWEGVR